MTLVFAVSGVEDEEESKDEEAKKKVEEVRINRRKLREHKNYIYQIWNSKLLTSKKIH